MKDKGDEKWNFRQSDTERQNRKRRAESGRRQPTTHQHLDVRHQLHPHPLWYRPSPSFLLFAFPRTSSSLFHVCLIGTAFKDPVALAKSSEKAARLLGADKSLISQQQQEQQSARLRSGASRPSASRRSRMRRNCWCRSPAPARRSCSTPSWKSPRG